MTPPQYQAAKWLKIAVLADVADFAKLFHALPACSLYPLGRIVNDLALSREAFLQKTASWTRSLAAGTAPTLADTKDLLACCLSKTDSDLHIQELPDGRLMMRANRPVVQIQAHFFSYSPEDEAFHSMVFGKGSVFWGVQFAFPQIVLDADTQNLEKVDRRYPNRELFQAVREWARAETAPTPFLAGGKKVNVPMRLGKSCFSWINAHPQLAARHLQVAS